MGPERGLRELASAAGEKNNGRHVIACQTVRIQNGWQNLIGTAVQHKVQQVIV